MKKTILLLTLLLNLSFINAQNVYVDFNPIIKGFAEVKVMDIQNDDKIIVAGKILTVDSTFVKGIARINSDGTYDETFNFEYKLEGQIFQILCQSDGKCILVGESISSELNDIIRLNSDGSIDESFNLETDMGCVLKGEIQSDGKYIFFNCNKNKIIRLNTDGSTDDTFTSLGDFDSYSSNSFHLKILSDDKILISGSFTTFNGESHRGLVKLNSDGTINQDFDIGTGMGDYSSIDAFGIQSDNKIVLVGYFTSFNGVTVKNIVRLNSDGSVDNTFTVPGPSVNVFSNNIGNIFILNNDKIILAGDIYTDRWIYKTMMLDANGNLESSFNIATLKTSPNISQLYNLPLDTTSTQNIIIGGPFIDFNGERRTGLASCTVTGDLNPFDAKLGAEPKINSVITQENGQVLIGGAFMEINGIPINNYARLNQDGSLDTNFITINTGSGPNKAIQVVAVQNNGKILLGGDFEEFNDDNTRSMLVRLNSDGSLDDTYAIEIQKDYIGFGINLIKPQINGKTIIAGHFSYINNINIKNLARINEDGSLDTQFNPNNIFEPLDLVYTIDFQSDTNIIVGGCTFGGGGFITRTDSLGVIDNSFDLDFSLSNTDVKALKVLPNDDIIFGGTFAQIFPDTGKPIYQIEKDGGIIDSVSFSIKDGSLLDICIDNDSTIIIAGSFKEVNYLDQPGIAKIDLKNGSTNFNLFNQTDLTSIKDIHIFNDSILYVGGEFPTTYNNTIFSGLAKFTINNHVPEILSINSVDSIKEDSLFYFSLDEIEISDYDNFIDNYSIIINGGDNYTINNDTIYPNENYNDSLVIPIKVNDGFDDSPIYNFTLKVLPINDTPVSTDNTVSTTEDNDKIFSSDDFTFTDIDSDTLNKIQIITLPAKGVLKLSEVTVIADDEITATNISNLMFTPVADENGSAYSTFTFKVHDGIVFSNNEGTMTINVSSINDAPVITGTTSTLTTYKNVPITLNLSDLVVEDVDNTYPDDFSLTVYSGDNYTFDLTTVTPATSYVGNIVVPVSVNDGTDNSNNYDITIEVILNTSVKDLLLQNNLNIYPIPFNEKLFFEYNSESDKFFVQILDMQGIVIYSEIYNHSKGLNKYEIKTSNFKEGMYIFKISEGDKIIQNKIIK